MWHDHVSLLLVLLSMIAVAGIAAGCLLAISGYSSAAAFSVASACVGVIGTLVATERHPPEPDAP